MSHLEFVKSIKGKKTENRFKMSRYDHETKMFLPTNIDYQYCIIGRNPDCSMRLINDKCSRYHCILYFTDDTLNVRDLDSKIGSYCGKVDGTQVVEKQQLPPFTQYHLEENDCIVIDEQIFKVDSIHLYRLNTERPIDMEPNRCQFCGEKVQLYLKEIQHIADQVQILDTVSQKTAAILSSEEQKVMQILTRLDQIQQAHKKFLEEGGEAGTGGRAKEVAFKSGVSVINQSAAMEGAAQEKEEQPLKSVKQRKNTPFVRNVAYDDE